MEEADVLCNRIGIVSDGILKCIGSQHRLKTLYGGGYHLFVNCQKAKYLKQLQERKMRAMLRKQSRNDTNYSDSEEFEGPSHSPFEEIALEGEFNPATVNQQVL